MPPGNSNNSRDTKGQFKKCALTEQLAIGRKSKVVKHWTFENPTLGQMGEAQGRISFHCPPINKS